jgi:hypothetical protein
LDVSQNAAAPTKPQVTVPDRISGTHNPMSWRNGVRVVGHRVGAEKPVRGRSPAVLPERQARCDGSPELRYPTRTPPVADALGSSLEGLSGLAIEPFALIAD